MRSRLLARSLAVLICLSAEAGMHTLQAAENAPAPEVVNAAIGGAALTLPTGWAIERRASSLVLTAPEQDSRIAVVDLKVKDVEEAIAAAWAAFDPRSHRALRISLPQAPANGWDARRYFEYETSPNERRSVFAYVWRAGERSVVVIVDASEATLEKRSADFNLVVRSLRPEGYRRETFAGRAARRMDAERIAVLKDFIATGMKQLGVPGVALSVIDRGSIVFEGGLGVKKLGSTDPVDSQTLFPAASNTKALTTLLLAILVDEGKLRWDEPVVEPYPAFRLGDAATSDRVLVRHLVCACTGLPRQDFEWFFEYRNATPVSSMKLLAEMQPTSAFGHLYQYSNLMAAAAGYVAAGIVSPDEELGGAYDRVMRSKVFLPLGMADTTFDFARAMGGNHARPHGTDLKGAPAVASMDANYSIVPVRPAGGVWTSAHDLGRYVRMELARGRLMDGKQQLVSAKSLLARQIPQVSMSEDVSYGMGLAIDTRWGVRIIRHGGALIGYRSEMFWLPEYGTGAVILTNSSAADGLLGPVLRRFAELLFDGRPEAEEQLRVAVAQRDQELAAKRKRLRVPPDANEVRKLAARYESAELGELAVRRENGTTIFDLGEWRSAVASRPNDDGTISFVTIDPTLQDFDFVAGTHEGRRTLTVRDAQHDYIFAESAER